jgi:hypothetical protein
VGIKVEIKDQKLGRHAPITKIMLASKLRKKNKNQHNFWMEHSKKETYKYPFH